MAKIEHLITTLKDLKPDGSGLNGVFGLPHDHGLSGRELGIYFSKHEANLIDNAWNLLFNNFFASIAYNRSKMYDLAQEPIKRFEELNELLQTSKES